MIEIPLWGLMILTAFAITFGFIVASVLASAGRDDDELNSYWAQVAFMSRSIMTEEQKDKLEKMMEDK